MRALVTGGAGFIGSHLVDLLLREGWEVRILDNLWPDTHPGRVVPAWTNAAAELMFGDVRNAYDCARGCRGMDAVFHLAAVGGFKPQPALMTAVNALGTVRIMEAARHAGVGRVVVASSQAVYGPLGSIGGVAVPLYEEAMKRPAGTYGRSKLYAEEVALELGAEWDLATVALRFALTYGPRQSTTNPYTGICSIFATAIRNGVRPVVFEDGLQTRDFTFVEDVALANLLAATSPDARGVYNVGTGLGTTVADFARVLALALDREDVEPLLTGEYRPLDARHVVVDPSRLKELGWEPRVPLPGGLVRYALWVAGQPRVPSVIDEALDELRAASVIRRYERPR